jgi:hypothetical protein
MARKVLTATDLSRNAIVLTEELSRLFHQRGVFPSLGGNNHYVNAVRIFLANSNQELLVSYYASVRNGERPIEERIWSAEIGKVAAAGDELTISFTKGRFVAEVRPAP